MIELNSYEEFKQAIDSLSFTDYSSFVLPSATPPEQVLQTLKKVAAILGQAITEETASSVDFENMRAQLKHCRVLNVVNDLELQNLEKLLVITEKEYESR